jgi:uncharacterized membrane-anchored protein
MIHPALPGVLSSTVTFYFVSIYFYNKVRRWVCWKSILKIKYSFLLWF